MTQRDRRRQRRRGGIGGKLLFVGARRPGLRRDRRDRGHLLGARTSPPTRPRSPPASRSTTAATRPSSPPTAASWASSPPTKRAPRSRSSASRRASSTRPSRSRTSASTNTAASTPRAIARAALKDLEAGKPVEGGSTITQQLVRNLCISHPERNLERKIVEAKLAIEYAERHSRPQILGQYLNTAAYGTVDGATAVGVGAAAKIFFSKPVWKLNLAQAALLAGLPQAPTEYNPVLNPRGALARRNEVLAKMASLGFVSAGRARQAGRHGLELNLDQGYFGHRQPYFFDYVESKLIETYGVNTVRKGGLDVYTTIDPHLQEVGLEAMRSALPYPEDPSSALVSIDPRDGHIGAMVSSSNYARSQFNLAAQGHRQPGSTFKAFVLTTAIKQGIDPYTTYYTSKHARPEPAALGPLGSAAPPTRATLGGSTCSRRRSPPTTPSSPSSTSTSARRTSPRRRSRWGSRARSTGSRRRESAACGSASRRWKWPTPTRPSPPAGSTTTRSRSAASSSPSGKVDRPERPEPRRVISKAVAYQVMASAARQHHRRDRHRRLHRLPGAGRQDRHDRQLHRRLVRRHTSRTWPPWSGSATRSRTRSK